MVGRWDGAVMGGKMRVSVRRSAAILYALIEVHYISDFTFISGYIMPFNVRVW